VENQQHAQLPNALSLRDCAWKALDIYNQHENAAEIDMIFGAGPWASESHARLADREIKALAEANGFTFEEVDLEMAIAVVN
jgi:hypothetical protein